MDRRKHLGSEGTRANCRRWGRGATWSPSYAAYRTADYSARLVAVAAYGALALLCTPLFVVFPPTGTGHWPNFVIGIRCLTVTLWLLLACIHTLQARRVRLVVTPRGLIYHRIGSTWGEIDAICPRGVVLAQPMELDCPWWNWPARCRDRSCHVLPLARFDAAWPGGRLGAHLRLHAPWLLETPVRAEAGERNTDRR